MQQVTAFLFGHWTAILLYLSIGTALVRGFDALAQKFPKLAPAASVVDALFHDVFEILGALASMFGLRWPPSSGGTAAKVAIVCLLAFLGCGIPAKTVVRDVCTVIDSGNPAIGALCLTAEEIASLFGHVRAARAFRASHPGVSPGHAVDVCEGSVSK
jgi:hypothetical protein